MCTETWLNVDDPNNFLPYHTRYNIYRCDRAVGRGGGVLIMVPKQITSFVSTPPSAVPDFEALWVSLVFNSQKTISLGVVYSPPSTDTQSLITYLNPSLSTSSPTILFGDFNFPDILWTENFAPAKYGQDKFLNFCLAAGINQEVSFPTRQNNILDLLFTSEPNIVQNIQRGPDIPGCDHITITAFMAYHMPKQNLIMYSDFRKANYEAMSIELVKHNWLLVLKPEQMSAEEMWTIFVSILSRLVAKYVPLRRFSCTKPWSSLTKKLCKRSYILHRRSRMTGIATDHAKYLEASRIAQQAKRRDKYNAEKDVLASGDLGRFWKFVSSRLANKSSVSCLTDSDGNVITDGSGKAHMLNDYFAAVFTPDNNKMCNLTPPIPSPKKFLSFIEFPPEKVYAELTCLPGKVSSGPDNFPSLLLQNLSLALAEPLSIIFRKSFTFSELPLDWRSADVTPCIKIKDKKPPAQITGP